MKESAKGRFFENHCKKKEKNKILLVLPFEEISLQPELSSPPLFRIQGGYPEHDGRRTKDGGKSLCLILDTTSIILRQYNQLIQSEILSTWPAVYNQPKQTTTGLQLKWERTIGSNLINYPAQPKRLPTPFNKFKTMLTNLYYSFYNKFIYLTHCRFEHVSYQIQEVIWCF